MNVAFLRQTVQSRDFALAQLFIVSISGVSLCLFPDFGVWALLIALIPWGFKLVAGISPFHRTSFDWLIAIFMITAGTGYWASYDKTIASTKFLLIVMSVLLFYALSAQPEENLLLVSTALFCVGVGISVYFFLTHDFIGNPRKLEVVNNVGRWIMQVRPSLTWTSIHPNYISGIAAITTPFIFYPLWKLHKSSSRKFAFYLFVILGLGVVLLALFMTTSRGILMALASAVGVWFLGRIVNLNGNRLQLAREAVFPSLVLIYLAVIVVVLYAGPAQSGNDIAGQYNFGTGSRAELFSRSAYLVSDFPFTGGGLGAFPALYSHYILGIPHYYVPNSHNLFLDVFIEQGILGGLAFFLLYFISIWQVARVVAITKSSELKAFGWLALIALVISFVHGMVDDYLYHEKGTILSMALTGISLSFFRAEALSNERSFTMQLPKAFIRMASMALLGLCLLNWGRIQSVWFANMGAVSMAKVELAGFPTDRWAGPEIATKLDSADASLHSSLELDPANRTANHRLGLIAMLRMDFPNAIGYLETALAREPRHRGIIKALGISYVWIGDLDSAQSMLVNIPETLHEMDAYAWWWQEQGHQGLSDRAVAIQLLMKPIFTQP